MIITGHRQTEKMADIVMWEKLGAVGIIFVITLTFSFIPYKLRNYLKNSTRVSSQNAAIFMSCSLCFGAGILLATVFLHMLKETREHIIGLTESGYITIKEYPLAELIFCCGFLIIYSFEEMVLNYMLKDSNPFNKQDNNNVKKKTKLEMNKSDVSDVESQDKDDNNIEECPDNCADVTQSERVQTQNILRSIIFMIAMYLHTFFEGLSIGLAGSGSEVWLLCLAFSSHKIFVVFSIALELLELNISRMAFCIYTFVFAIVPPVGTTVGILLTRYLTNNNAEELTVAVLTGISGGTILFVIFCEILERERAKPFGRMQKLASLLLGFIVMALIMMIPEGAEEDFHVSVVTILVPETS